jgi:hypothetical protein
MMLRPHPTQASFSQASSTHTTPLVAKIMHFDASCSCGSLLIPLRQVPTEDSTGRHINPNAPVPGSPTATRWAGGTTAALLMSLKAKVSHDAEATVVAHGEAYDAGPAAGAAQCGGFDRRDFYSVEETLLSTDDPLSVLVEAASLSRPVSPLETLARVASPQSPSARARPREAECVVSALVLAFLSKAHHKRAEGRVQGVAWAYSLQ